MRIEKDLLGEQTVPKSVCYGAQTQRAVENFPVTGIPIHHFTHLVRSLAMVKKAAAEDNLQLGLLPADKARWIAQLGSSLMPGKVNPVIPEAVNQIAFHVVAYNVLDSMRLLTSGARLLAQRCITGITANRERCRELVESSIGLVTALNGHLGYEQTSMLAKEALIRQMNVRELVLEKQLMHPEELEQCLDIIRMTRPHGV
jgi:aspartate ammonia-lyase